MKATELRDMKELELNKRLADLKQELFNLRFQHAINQLDNPQRIVIVKREIARLKTVMHERNLQVVVVKSEMPVESGKAENEDEKDDKKDKKEKAEKPKRRAKKADKEAEKEEAAEEEVVEAADAEAEEAAEKEAAAAALEEEEAAEEDKTEEAEEPAEDK